MTAYALHRLTVVSLVLLSTVGLAGCASNQGSSAPPPVDSSRVALNAGGTPTDVTVEPVISTVVDARPAALVDGRAVTFGDLRSSLTELAGVQALREFVLDRALAEEVRAAGMVISSDAIESERRRLLETLSDDQETALRLLDELRARQGLGPERFRAMLTRNASLRALVGPRTAISGQAVRDMYEIRHGDRREARIIVAPTLSDARRARDEIVAGGAAFTEVASRRSTDISAARGGLLEPISLRDPTYPQAMRDALYRLNEGEISAPVLVDDGYMLLQYVRPAPGDGADFESVRPGLERLVRLKEEAIRMDLLAARLLRGRQIDPIDPSLRAMWNRNRR